jgi:hypothetical protein
MYDVNPHLSHKDADVKLRGGAFKSVVAVTTPSVQSDLQLRRVQNGIGCIVISILAMHASTTAQRGVAHVGLLLISLISALSTLYTGVLLYKDLHTDQTGHQKPADGHLLVGFILLNACMLLYINAQSTFALVY